MSRSSLPIGSLLAWSALAVSAVVVGWSLPIDDFFLTIASGREIAEGATVSQPLPFSWTEEVPGALNPQWGAQVLLGWHGSTGVALAINSALLAAGLGVTVLRSASRASAVAVAAALLLALAALAPHLLARAQSFSIALFPIAMLLLERYGRRWWLPLAYGGFIVAWANLHGAFVVGQLAAAAWLFAAVLRGGGRAIALVTAVVAVVAPLLNPVGPALLAYAYGQPGLEVVSEISVEWQPSWPWIAVATPFWLILTAIVAGRWLRRPGAGAFDLILLVLMGALAISGIRHIPWFLLVAAPVLATDIDALVRRSPRLRAAMGALPPTFTGRGFARLLVILGVAILTFQLARPSLPPGLARLTPDEPVRQVDLLGEIADPGGRILNEQVWGGYLVYRLPEALNAMDGRLEIRSRDTWAWYFDVMQGEGDPAAELAANGVGWALIGVDRGQLRDALEVAGWRVADADAYAVLLGSPAAEAAR